MDNFVNTDMSAAASSAIEITLPDGSRPVWQSDALAYLTDHIASLDSLESQWNARDHVTLKPAGQRAAFFLRARTDERWWFRAEFRTEKGLFDQADLSRQLRIKSWNDVPELQVYGKWSRVRVNAREKRWDRITLFLWSLAEIDTPAFRKFLEDCHAGYCRVAGIQKTTP